MDLMRRLWRTGGHRPGRGTNGLSREPLGSLKASTVREIGGATNLADKDEGKGRFNDFTIKVLMIS